MGQRLIFEIGGDTTPLVKALQGAMKTGGVAAKAGGAVAGSEFTKQFGQQVKAGIMSYIGAGAILGGIRKVIGEATKITNDAAKQGLGVEAMQELQKAAELTGMTVDELRKAAPEVAEAFTKLMSAVKEGGGILDAATVQTLADAAQDLKELQNKLAPGVAFLARSLNGVMSVLQRVGQFAVGAAHGVVAVARGDRDWGQAADEMMNEAWNGTGFESPNRNAQREAAEGLRSSIASRQAEATATRQAFQTAAAPLGTAGGERDLSLVSMIPGASAEMVEELKKAVRRLENIDDNLR